MSKPQSPPPNLFVDPPPAAGPVDVGVLLTDITSALRKFLVITPEQADAAALWLVHTHALEAADVSPIVIINAPERACAKTLFLNILSRMAYRPLPAANASLSAIFRAIESWGVTLMIDEADTFFGDNKDQHGVINAGYKRGGFVLRTEASGDSFTPKAFNVFGPKAIAGISLERHLPDATMSRGIVFNMRRKLNDEKVERVRRTDDALFAELHSRLARVALDRTADFAAIRPNLPDALGDRAQDSWEPLLAIATAAGPEWLERATRAALTLSVSSEALGSTGNDLLADIRTLLAEWTKPTIPTVELLEKLLGDPDMGWDTYNRGKPITPRQLAKLLDAYGIKPKTVRQPKSPIHPTGSTPKGYEVGDFKDAFTRYLKPEPEEVHAPSTSAATAQQVNAPSGQPLPTIAKTSSVDY